MIPLVGFVTEHGLLCTTMDLTFGGTKRAGRCCKVSTPKTLPYSSRRYETTMTLGSLLGECSYSRSSISKNQGSNISLKVYSQLPAICPAIAVRAKPSFALHRASQTF